MLKDISCFLLNDDWLVNTISVQTFTLIILISRKGNFVYHNCLIPVSLAVLVHARIVHYATKNIFISINFLQSLLNGKWTKNLFKNRILDYYLWLS